VAVGCGTLPNVIDNAYAPKHGINYTKDTWSTAPYLLTKHSNYHFVLKLGLMLYGPLIGLAMNGRHNTCISKHIDQFDQLGSHIVRINVTMIMHKPNLIDMQG